MTQAPSEAQKRAMQAGRAESRALYAKRRADAMKVGTWEVFGLDEWSRAIRRLTDAPDDLRYYPNMAQALNAIFHQRIGERSAHNLDSVLKAVHDTRTEVLDALKKAFPEAVTETPRDELSRLSARVTADTKRVAELRAQLHREGGGK